MWTSSSSSSAYSRSFSSSSTPCPSPYTTTNTASATATPRLTKTMEEVWKDITLAADLHRPSSRGVILQDFFSKDPPPPSVSSARFSASPPPPPPPPPTMLTLSSGPDHFSSLLLQPHRQIQPIPHVNVAAFDAVVPDDNAAGGRKRFQEFDRSSGDRRHKRMIKNRESAARSRARKQAYTNELELEVAHLLEENAKLKKQQEQLYRAAAAENQKRKPLHRTSTAPF